MTDLSNQREYYYHDAGCPEENFTNLNDRGLKTCLDCAGVFDAEGKGVCVTDKRFDEHYEDRKAAVEADSNRS